MKPVFVILLIFVVAPTRSFSASSSSPTISHSSNNSACPVGMDYVLTVPWNSSSCHNFQAFPSKNKTRSSFCCTTLLALAQNLKENSLFQLPNLPTSKSCLHDFQSKLNSLSLPNNLVSSCFDPLQFVISPNICAHIQSKQDWINILGPTTQFNNACKPDLSVSANCDVCVTEDLNLLQKMNAIDGNASHSQDCFYFSILYAAGIANELGPESRGALSCIFELPLNNAQVRGARRKSHKHTLIFCLIGASIGIFAVLSFLIGLRLWYNRLGTRKGAENLYVYAEPTAQGSRSRVKPNTGSIWFKFEDLVKATNNFSPQNFIGRGGFGLVYKGILPDGTMVAVKRIEESASQGDEEFYREVEIISNLKHRNLVRLRGCCVVDEGEEEAEEEDPRHKESQKYLVYDYMPNGSLEDHLFSSMDNQNAKKSLTWSQRKSIILDVANGLVYLHFGVKPAIYHRDIKATNILLDAGMNARVADFGLARQNIESRSQLNTRVAGTHGYLAPEYARYGQLSEKSDVYSFGVVILEILCGRKALDLSSSGTPAFFISDWVWSLLKSADSRPTILDALKMLEGDIEIPPIPDRPMALGHHEFPMVIQKSENQDV
ncbi:hypothetical protein PIB30_005967 [Stylosanthes scabra]|uniref:Protein kinase domain-containing protein n=1 Tax=Stylosanthes scabra TaxID=79078 RepID=A0ABU6S4Q3_9FABA|nr:hypothetical protein [Stylosanthes scabra]